MVETYSGCKPDLQLSDIMARPETTYSTKWIDHLIEGYVEVSAMKIPVLSRKITLKDRLGSLMVRCGVQRMSYHFPAGLYLIGEQAPNLPVIVTCNYKLTLDSVRSSLKGPGYWLLVLDTKGVNVWCAAGKGTFGTEELIFQLTKWQVKSALKAREVILPQLGASRMTPHVVQSLTGVKVSYGPVRAEDLDAFLAQNKQATEAQRTVTFNWRERLVLTPVEFLMSIRYLLAIWPLQLVWHWLKTGSLQVSAASMQSLAWLIMMFSGAVLFPLLLPILPSKGFSTKSLWLGIPVIALVMMGREWFMLGNDLYQLLAFSIGYLICISYLALNFTGSTTFTSFSGVAYEVGKYKQYVRFAGIAAVLLMVAGLVL